MTNEVSSTHKYKILNAADFGVPQERRRLFLVGTRDDQAVTALLPSATVRAVPKRSEASTLDDVESGLPLGPTAGDALRDPPNLNEFPRLLNSDEVELSAARMAAMDAAASEYARRLRYIDREPTDLSYARSWDRTLLTGSMRTAHTDKSVRRFRATRHGTTETISRFYKLDPDGLCNTLRAGSGSERGAFTSPRPLHPDRPRVLSNREAARLHSFPDWFRFHTTKWHGFRQIGNAVAPLVGRAVGAEVIERWAYPSRATKPIELGDTALLRLTMSQATARFGADEAHIPARRTRGAVPGVATLDTEPEAVVADPDAATGPDDVSVHA